MTFTKHRFTGSSRLGFHQGFHQNFQRAIILLALMSFTYCKEKFTTMSPDELNQKIESLSHGGFDEDASTLPANNSFSVKQPKKVKLSDRQVKAYIKFSQALRQQDEKLLEKIQSLVPTDMAGLMSLATSAGFSSLQDFADANLVIGVAVNALLAAQFTDKTQGKTKQEYIQDFTKDLDDNDEFDRKMKAEMEKTLNSTLTKLEEQGVVGNKSEQMFHFVVNDLKKKKIGEENTEIIMSNFTDLESVWVMKFGP